MRYGIEAEDIDALVKLIDDLHITFREGCAQLDGVDVSNDIRAEAVGNRASAIAVHGPVRTALVARQRAFRKTPASLRTARHGYRDLPGRRAEGVPDGQRRGARDQTA